ncbi:DUF58 domain-containing protein [Pseudoxanthomonas gei]|uniref:DUF58 domain-containing protein n=1 Tax=Pseudoxanthomonas gei TaxID=1383030 RepID=A0ABX0ACS2_9GAMM|nr:DUF58 domain-containing protein [Pseudoxanthomonas gei]NDK39374.1 DUF58 domain-containing protein [Pseudoxanthomonas gei]
MRPAPLLIALLVGWGLAGLTVLFADVPLHTWQITGLAIALLAMLDGLLLRRRATPVVTREIPQVLPLGIEREVTLRVESRVRQRVDVFDLHPGSWPAQGMPQTLKLAADTASTFSYRLRPIARGDASFEGVQLRLASPLRLWTQSRVAGAPQRVRVYPNFAPLTKFALFSAERASRLVGAHLRRRRGEGTDFNQMREYRVGDSLRQIDWKATSRSRKLISREYQEEKNQQLVMMVDTGRRMMARDPAPTKAGSELAHFDHVLNAALVVSYLALRQGDAVGLFASGGDSRWVAPRRGMASIDALLRASYDLQPQAVATDYLAAASELSLRQRKRSLVMLVTNVRDEDIEDLLAAVRLLQKRHLVCVASLRERALDQAMEEEVHDLPGAIRAGAIARYLEQRTAAHDALRSHRVMVLDVASEELPAALVERYLAVKRQGLL